MRLLFIGDIVGKPGVKIVCQALRGLRHQEQLNLVIANAENADSGSGITPAIYRKLKEAGVDCITLGDHIYRKKDISTILESESDIVKPANYPVESPGKTWTTVKTTFGRDIAVISLMGRVFMRPVDCPFHAVDRVLKEIPDSVGIRFVDFHAEATSDKQVMGRYLDGRVSAVLGTHTHVTTADERILPGGTAFQCDVGMTGPHESILGRDIKSVTETTVTFHPRTFNVAKEDVRISGTIVDIDRNSGKATGIRRIVIDEAKAMELENIV